jgi:hypothetical protein
MCLKNWGIIKEEDLIDDDGDDDKDKDEGGGVQL